MAFKLDRSFWKDIARIAAGALFLLLGVLGLFLPILQGLLFLAIAAMLLAPYVPAFHRLKLYLFRRFPGLRHGVQLFRRWLHRHVPFTRPNGRGPSLRPMP